ncbi:hypothetical protein [Deinococcus marmoris]|uniref:hypothetical protein n=1 Tax=Deinococcus marmoris TaxID=249408 RepID=UPI000496CFCF|nr:hypothetical protein [Deinococcus marmoris]
MTTVDRKRVHDYQDASRRLHDELAEEARRYLELLERERRGEDVDGELYASTVHLGTHATLLADRMDEDPELDAGDDEN